MSKIKMNATTYDLVSALKLDDIKMLESIKSPALSIKDKDGNPIFTLLTGKNSGTNENAVMFAQKDMDGYAVMTFPMDTSKTPAQIRESVYATVGGIKKYLDQIEVAAVAAVAEETERKAAFIADLMPETDADTAATAAEQNG